MKTVLYFIIYISGKVAFITTDMDKAVKKMLELQGKIEWRVLNIHMEIHQQEELCPIV